MIYFSCLSGILQHAVVVGGKEWDFRVWKFALMLSFPFTCCETVDKTFNLQMWEKKLS